MGFFDFLKKTEEEEAKPFRMICWFEIPAFNFRRAVDFYKTVFEMTIEETAFNDIPHGIITSLNKNDQINGAIMETKENESPGTGSVLFFNVTGRMDEVIEKIQENGGVILKEKTLIKNKEKDGKSVIPKTLIDGKEGYFCYFLDTEGNKMALYGNN
jgi:predicted enzyme related to lactoylglutathione lyase